MPRWYPLALLLLAAPTGVLAAQAAPDSVWALAQAGRPGDAYALGRSLADAAPDSPEAQAALAVGAMAVRDFDRAVKAADVAVALAPEVSRWQLVFGQAYLSHARANPGLGAIGKVKRGRAAVERAIALDPDNLDARTTLLQFLLQAPGIVGGSRDGARAQALEIERRDRPRGLLARLDVAAAGGQRDELLQVYADAMPLLEARATPGLAEALLAAAGRLKNRELRELLTARVYAAAPAGEVLTP